MIMGAKKLHYKNQSGQSILEFAFILPVFLLLLIYMLQASMAINMGIGNQKWARLRLYELLYHDAYYFRTGTMTGGAGNRVKPWRRMWIGVDHESWQNDEIEERASLRYLAPWVAIGVPGNPRAGDEPGDFPADTRKTVRIRVRSFMCIPAKFMPSTSNAGGLGPRLLSETMDDRAYRGGSSFIACDKDDR